MADKNGFEELLHLGYKYSDAQLAAYERQIVGDYRDAWLAIRKELIALYKDGPVYLADMNKYNRLASLETELSSLYRYYSRAAERVQIAGVSNAVEVGHNITAYAIEAFNPDAIRFGMVDPATIEAALANPYSGLPLVKTLRGNEKAGITKVWKTLVSGMARGVSYADMANSVKSVFEKSSISSAVTVLRTEGHRAQVIGQNSAIDQAEGAGVQGKRYWMATLDDVVRESHKDMDGQEEDDDGMFEFPSGEKTEGPGLSGIAEEDINCRCRIGYKIKGLEPDTRRMRDPVTGKTQLISWQNYREWEAQMGRDGRKQSVARVSSK